MIFNKILKVSSLTMVSRIFGLVRDILTAVFLGASYISDAFFIAFKLPNIFRKLFAEGSFNTVFIPVFVTSLSNDGKQSAIRFAQEVLTILLISLFIIIGVMEVFMPQVMYFIAPGLKHKSYIGFNLVVNLTRLTLPYLFFISVATLFGSILNGVKKFSVVALLPLILNITLIVFLLISAYFNNPILTAYFGSLGITISGLLQLIVVFLYAKKQGWILKLSGIRSLSKSTVQFFKRLVPVIITAGMYQINIFIDITIASLLAGGSITYLYYGERLNQLPLAIIGIAISVVILPFVAGALNTSKKNKIKNQALSYAVLLGVPSVLGFWLFGKEIVKMLFFHGNFSMSSVNATYLVLLAYSIGLIPNIFIKILVAIFYAEKRNYTPFFVNSGVLILNVGLALLLSHFFSYVGIALATSIGSILSSILLLFLLIKSRLIVIEYFFVKEVIKGLLSGVIIFGLAIIIKKSAFDLVIQKVHSQILTDFLLISFMLLIMLMYFYNLKLLKSELYYEIKKIFKKKYE